MAYTLEITDGTTTVNLIDSAGLFLASGGWKPQVTRLKPNVLEYEDMVETLECDWMQTNDNDRATKIQNLMNLGYKAEEYWRKRLVVRPVWMKVSTPSETGARYALIKNIQVTELDSKHFGPNSPVKLVLKITREGAWRSVAPNGSLTSWVAATSVQNNVYDDDVNWLDIQNTDAEGDALGLAKIQIVAANSQERVIVALRSSRSASSADENNLYQFNPHFNAAAIYNSMTDVVADAGAPGGSKWERVNPGVLKVVKTWELPDDLSDYAGEHLVYAVCKVTTDDKFGLIIGHGADSTGVASTNVQDEVLLETTTNYQMVYLGRMTLPASEEIPGVNGDFSSYYLHLFSTSKNASTGTFSLRNIFLVPVDEGVMDIDLRDDRVAIDSVIERTYHYTSLGYHSDYVPVPRGRYFKFKPNVFHRLYFYYTRADGDGGVTPSDQLTVTVTGLDRFTALRGSVS